MTLRPRCALGRAWPPRLAAALAAVPAFLALAGPACAQKAPAALIGKSIVVTWSEARMQRPEGKGEYKSLSIPSGLSIYVSSAGRTFVRRTASGRGGRGTAARESLGAGKGAAGAHATRFQGRSLDVTAAFVEGAARSIQVQFDERFSACSARVAIGRDASGAPIRMKTYAGDMVEIQSISAGAAACAVRDGNVFAN